MITLCYAGVSEDSARRIAATYPGEFQVNRGMEGDINWGRYATRAKLNRSIVNATDKHRMRLLFRDNEVPSPTLVSTAEALELAALGTPVLGRSNHHTGGKGYWLCTTETDVRRAIQGTEHKAPATHFVRYITGNREYRVHIFQGKSIRLYEKRFLPNGDWVEQNPQHDVSTIRQAAKDAVAALELDFGAVDVLTAQGKVYVLEVNTAPELDGGLPKLYADTFLEWHSGA